MEVGLLLAGVGKFDDALAIFRGVTPPENPCARSSLFLNIASTLVERATRLQGRRPEPEVASALASAEKATRACPDHIDRRWP